MVAPICQAAPSLSMDETAFDCYPIPMRVRKRSLDTDTKMLGAALLGVVGEAVMDLYERLYVALEDREAGDARDRRTTSRVAAHEVEMRGGNDRLASILSGA